MKSKKAKIFVLPTDTLYGICASAFCKEMVEKIYDIKGRNEKKPFIILISNPMDLEKFGISKTFLKAHKELLEKVWPGKISVILPISDNRFAYLHRGKKSLAFRMPRKKSLQMILKKTGPLVAPSANPEGLKPAQTIREAKAYFGDKVDVYVSGGRLTGAPSTIIEIAKNGYVKLVREGRVKVSLSN